MVFAVVAHEGWIFDFERGCYAATSRGPREQSSVSLEHNSSTYLYPPSSTVYHELNRGRWFKGRAQNALP